MKRLVILCTIGALCAGNVFSGENEKEEKKVPPGLQKKDGVAPGQAKKKGQATEATSTATPAAAPATATAPAAAAAPAPVTATAKPAAAPAKTTLADQKALLEANTRAINHATEGKSSVHNVALQHIAKETGVSVEHLREQDKNFPGASDTGLLLGNVIARKANVKFADVIKARHAGKHWDEIAKAHNVDYGLLVQKSSQLAQALNAGGAR